MGTATLRLSILGTLVLVIGISTLFFAFVLSLAGVSNLFALVILVALFNVVQWLVAPYLIDLMYRVREVSATENPWLHTTVERLSLRSRIGKPRVMLASIPIPNAFAYGSPIAGTRVAVTRGLLDRLEREEVEAVIGHEIGHLKHRDVQVMMFVSVLPAICYYLALSLLWAPYYRQDRRQSGGTALMGGLALVVYFVLTLCVLHLSRLREYFADRHSAQVVEDGPRKLSEGLAKIVRSSRDISYHGRGVVKGLSGFRALLIADPERAGEDAALISGDSLTDRQLVQGMLRREVTLLDRFTELLSTHPNIVKRLRALQQLS